jgi:hypothetical protein
LSRGRPAHEEYKAPTHRTLGAAFVPHAAGPSVKLPGAMAEMAIANLCLSERLETS